MSSTFTREEIEKELKSILVEDFEINESKITPDANLFEDLEFDSIDAVDLAVRLQDYTQKKISHDNFKQIRTVKDVVDAIEELVK